MTKKGKRYTGKKPLRRLRLTDTDAESEVGYGKPPKAYQFKPGKSGNPSGRPKGRKNEATLVRELLDKKISVQERGKTRRIAMLEALLRRILEDALRGNIKSANFLFGLYNAPLTGQTIDHLSEDDQSVLDAFTAQLKDDLAKGGLDDEQA